MSYLIFENPGEIDPRAIRTFGVNVKEGRHPIGQFGTGMKFALAVLLRTGHEVEVHSGAARYGFSTERSEIRGRAFDLVVMRDGRSPPLEMGFTTDLGKHWELWMAHRELWCNMVDEEGEARVVDHAPPPKPGVTRFIVTGDGMLAAHAARAEHILEAEPDVVTHDAGMFFRGSDFAFYRGLRVLKLPKPAALTYNVLREIRLTEDRTASSWEIGYHVTRALAACEDPTALAAALREGTYEADLDFDGVELSPAFMEAVQRLVRSRAPVGGSALRAYERSRRAADGPTICALSGPEKIVLADALKELDRLGLRGSRHPVVVAEELDEPRGEVEHGKIYITRAALVSEPTSLLATLLRLHLRADVDTSAALEDSLADLAVVLARKIAEQE